MKLIPLTQGHVTQVDDADFESLWMLRWHLAMSVRKGTGKACKYAGNNTHGYMHRMLMGAGKGQKVDHKDGNGLNNQRENLRLCTHSQNIANSGARTSRGLKGIWLNADGKWWTAMITVNRKRIYLGCFTNKEDAARAYDIAAVKYFGEFARLNFPLELSA